ncbi:MAG TPA: hypothetical protein VME23_06795 [Terracidiphilus sp.]|nr:hypothetical protein [Terracidiphilus sp.]
MLYDGGSLPSVACRIVSDAGRQPSLTVPGPAQGGNLKRVSGELNKDAAAHLEGGKS